MTTGAATTIRPAEMEDREAVQALWEAAGLGRAAPDEWDALMGGDTAVILVARHDDEIAGTAVASFDGWRAYIYHVAVDERHRRQGIAQQLVREAEAYLLGAGARYVYVTVHEANTEGLALVGAVGYLPEGEMVLAKRLAVRTS